MSHPVSVLIVEDEAIIANKIAHHLEQFGYRVSGILQRGEQVVEHCRTEAPDVILLDINLKGKLDGVETAQALERRGIDVPLIYLTANTDQATFERAKNTRPRAFLGKPYDRMELHRAVSLAVVERQRKEVPTPHLLSDRIFVRHKDRMVKVFLKDIEYITAERAYCHIHTGETEYLLSISMGKLSEQLHSGDFLRVHRSYVVNLRKIDSVADDHLVIGNQAIPISKDQRAELTSRINLIR